MYKSGPGGEHAGRVILKGPVPSKWGAPS